MDKKKNISKIGEKYAIVDNNYIFQKLNSVKHEHRWSIQTYDLRFTQPTELWRHKTISIDTNILTKHVDRQLVT